MEDLSEKEQLEQIRQWWSEYGGYVILGIAAGALLLFGFNYYQSSKESARAEASTLFESLANHVVDGELEDAEGIAGRLDADFANTIYAAQSKLAMARLYMDKNRDQDAADVLRELIDSEAGDGLKQIARLRLARILLYQDEPQQVIELLEGLDDQAFAAPFSEVLGDAYYAAGRVADAEAAYQRVLLDPTAQGTVDQQLLQWKVLDLPEVGDPEPADVPDSAPAELPDSEPVMTETPDAAAIEPETDAVEDAVEEAVEDAVEEAIE